MAQIPLTISVNVKYPFLIYISAFLHLASNWLLGKSLEFKVK